MNFRSVAAGAALATVCSAGAASAAPVAPSLREHLTLNPAATIWTGEAPAELCAIGRTLQVTAGPMAVRHGAFHRNGQLVAEILAPPPLAGGVTRTARLCAQTAAAGGVGGGFGEALASCLRRTDAARYVGAVTFWIDADCAL
jgi:hypothetical protein